MHCIYNVVVVVVVKIYFDYIQFNCVLAAILKSRIAVDVNRLCRTNECCGVMEERVRAQSDFLV